MLINVPSVTEEGIKDKAELRERCEFVATIGEATPKYRVDFVYKEKATGVLFKLPVVVGYGDGWGGVDDKYDFPYSADFIKNNIVQRKEREVVTIEEYYE